MARTIRINTLTGRSLPVPGFPGLYPVWKSFPEGNHAVLTPAGIVYITEDEPISNCHAGLKTSVEETLDPESGSAA